MTRGRTPARNSAGASSARGIRTRSVGPVSASGEIGCRTRGAHDRNTTSMLALLYDIHGNLAALDAVIADARERGADACFIGGDVALFGPGPRETLMRLFELRPAIWIRGNGERWTADPGARARGRRAAPCRPRARISATGSSRRSPRCPRARRWTTARAPGTARRSPTCAPSRPSPPTTRPSCSSTSSSCASSSATRTSRSRASPPATAASSSSTPAASGCRSTATTAPPYALLHDDGTIEHRRVGYDHVRVPVALRARFGDAAVGRRASSSASRPRRSSDS